MKAFRGDIFSIDQFARLGTSQCASYFNNRMSRRRWWLTIFALVTLNVFQFFKNESRNMQIIIQASLAEGGEMYDAPQTTISEAPQKTILEAQSTNNKTNNIAETLRPTPPPTPPPLQEEARAKSAAASFAALQRYRREQAITGREIIVRLGNKAAGIAKRADRPITHPEGYQPPKYDYRQGLVSMNSTTLPPPNVTDQSIIVLVLSGVDNFEQRTAIRETYSKDNSNVYFVVGGIDPENQQQLDQSNPQSIISRLWQEQQEFGDLIDSVRPDSYKSLPYKLHFGMKWVYDNVKSVQWVVKADDDQVVRVKRLEFFVLQNLNPSLPLVLGDIAVGGAPHRTGKWAEDPKFKGSKYPPWPFGSAGYIVSRPIVEYLATTDNLYYYQGEDAGLGIWLNESPLQVVFLDTPEVQKFGACQDQFYIIGHDLGPKSIRDCFAKLGDEIPERKHIISYTAARKDQHPHHIRKFG